MPKICTAYRPRVTEVGKNRWESERPGSGFGYTGTARVMYARGAPIDPNKSIARHTARGLDRSPSIALTTVMDADERSNRNFGLALTPSTSREPAGGNLPRSSLDATSV